MAIGLLGVVLRGRRHRMRAVRELRCPGTGEQVRCVISRDTLNGCWIDVESCTACDPPEQVRCARTCVGELNREARA
jgi:hypothetical protein